MPFRLGPMELVIILAIVMLLFGAGRLPQIGENLGKGISGFRKALSGKEEETTAQGHKEQGDHTAARG